MAAGDLTTLANVKAWLNIPTDTSDDMLQRLLSAASLFAQKWMDRWILSATYAEQYTGSGSNTLALRQYPVTEVSAVSIHGHPIPMSPDGHRAGYIFDEMFLYLIGLEGIPFGRSTAPGVFPKFPPKAVSVTYTAGFETVPLELEQAVLELIALKWADRSHFGQASKSVGGEVVSYITADMPKGVATLLGNYKKVIPV